MIRRANFNPSQKVEGTRRCYYYHHGRQALFVYKGWKYCYSGVTPLSNGIFEVLSGADCGGDSEQTHIHCLRP